MPGLLELCQSFRYPPGLPRHERGDKFGGHPVRRGYHQAVGTHAQADGPSPRRTMNIEIDAAAVRQHDRFSRVGRMKVGGHQPRQERKSHPAIIRGLPQYMK